MIVCLFNGPPRCGKDHSVRKATSSVIDGFNGQFGISPVKLKFADELKERTHALYGLFDEMGRPLPADAFEDTKDLPSPRFLGKTPRDAYIAVSETYYKPHHGLRIFGELALQRLDRMMGGEADPKDPSVVLIADSGFTRENEPLIERFGRENIMLVRIHALDKATGEFKLYTDSRSYIDLGPDVLTVDLVNDMTIGYEALVHEVVSEFTSARLVDMDPTDPLAAIRGNQASTIFRSYQVNAGRKLSPDLPESYRQLLLPAVPVRQRRAEPAFAA